MPVPPLSHHSEITPRLLPGVSPLKRLKRSALLCSAAVSLALMVLLILLAPDTIRPARAQSTPIVPVSVPTDLQMERITLDVLRDRIESTEARFDRYLGIVEAISGILGVVALVAGFAGLRSIGEARNDLKQQVEVQREATKREREDNERQQKQLENFQATIRSESKAIDEAREDIRKTATTVDDLTRRYRNIAQAQSLSLLGLQQIQLGNLVTAEETLQSASNVDPDNPVIQYFLGEVMIRQNKIDEAQVHLQQAMEAGSLPQANVTYAYAVRLQGDKSPDDIGRELKYAESIKIYLSEFVQHPELVDIYGESAYGALAGLYRRQGRLDEAIYYYEHALRITPNASYPVNNLAILNFLKGNQLVGRRYFQQSLEIAKSKLVVYPRDYWTWFDLVTAEMVLLGASDEEVDAHIRKAVELAPKREPLRKFLRGLNELAAAPKATFKFEPVIDYVQHELDRREQLKELEDKARISTRIPVTPKANLTSSAPLHL